MNNFKNNENAMRSSESTTVVFNSSAVPAEGPKKPEPKTVKRSNFWSAKAKAVALYERMSWILNDRDVAVVDTPVHGVKFGENEARLQMNKELTSGEALFKKCLLQSIREIDGYNELAFKKDLAQHMSLHLENIRFDRTCRKARWSKFMLAQRLAWAKAEVVKEVYEKGLAFVTGFDTCENVAVYRYYDLLPDFLALGFEEEDFEGDPYSLEGEAIWNARAEEG